MQTGRMPVSDLATANSQHCRPPCGGDSCHPVSVRPVVTRVGGGGKAGGTFQVWTARRVDWGLRKKQTVHFPSFCFQTVLFQREAGGHPYDAGPARTVQEAAGVRVLV